MPGVRTSVVRIGNSQGIRIPRKLLEQCRLGRDVELEPKAGYLIVRSATVPRLGWDEAFQRMADAGDDALLDEPAAETEWEAEEWQW